MYLKKIKLAGFKSFVDPITVPMPSNLIGVIGPNGCGKSNIIDAVRWVMGESSAKQLRGENLADVIFNGSSARKPVSQASVELIFDNSQGRIGGQYASYQEISVKRNASRDGQSNYYLNGVKCRKRDITDVFLGTGLGPRSYSIIEQGMISRFIDAKPDDLRTFLEEAAGISKYKERRRETENRIRHTRDNLDRLSDLRDELAKQLEKLHRQAKAAERYKELKQEQRILSAQTQAFQWQVLDQQLQQHQLRLNEQENSLQQVISEQRELDQSLEHNRSQQHDLVDAHQEIQERFYQINSDIARIEQQLTHQRELQNKLQHDYQQAKTEYEQARAHLQEDEQRVITLQGSIQALQPQSSDAVTIVEQEQSQLESAEQAMTSWQTQWDQFSQFSAQASQQAEVEKTHIEHLRERNQTAQQRKAVIEQELQTINTDELQQEIDQLQQEVEQQQTKSTQLEKELGDANQQLEQTRQQDKTLAERLEQGSAQLHELKGQYAGLKTMQQAALGKQNDNIHQWLAKQDIANKPRLAESITVEPKWRKATELVLSHYLSAICVDDNQQLEHYLSDLPNANMTLLLTKQLLASNNHGSKPTLADKVTAPWSLTALLEQVYIAENNEQALTIAKQLQPHEAVITPEGIYFNRYSVSIYSVDDEKAGVLERETAIKELQQKITEKEQQIKQLHDQQQDIRQRLSQSEQQREQLLQHVARQQQQISSLEAQHKTKGSDYQHQINMQQRLTQELEHIVEQMTTMHQDLTNSERSYYEASQDLTAHLDKRENLLSQREVLQQQLSSAKQQAQSGKEQAHKIALELQGYQSELATKEQAIGRAKAQLTHLQHRFEQIQQQQNKAGEPIEKLQLERDHQLDEKLEIEKQVNKARNAVNTIEETISGQEHKHRQLEHAISLQREQLQTLRMDQQAVAIKRDTIAEQLQVGEHNIAEVLATLTDDMTAESLNDQLTKINNQIQRLGAINLAAIEEQEQLTERKDYLDKQNADLEEALTTLESAIKKIDRETRDRFKQTYEDVNNNFQNLFVKVFNGGSARLELTDDDWLTTGIMIKAQPPGKRNTSIHLLSGGEKALTAMALIFSIFNLNPAPFCLLDEVDAPLDDANTMRYCNLVKEMSDKVQFIFITHNKITMEMADQLTGVTMREPGVSRLVSVDVGEALELAAA